MSHSLLQQRAVRATNPFLIPDTIMQTETSPEFLDNHPFDSIRVGDGATLVRQVTNRDIQLFAAVSGDVNPAHVDAIYARSSHFQGIIAHGMLGASLVSTVLGTRFPGPGTVYLGQTLKFARPVHVGDTLTVSVTVISRDEERHRLLLDTRCVNQDGVVVIEGEADVIAPTESLRIQRTEDDIGVGLAVDMRDAPGVTNDGDAFGCRFPACDIGLRGSRRRRAHRRGRRMRRRDGQSDRRGE